LLLTVLAVVRDRASCKRTTTTPATNMAKHTILYFDFDFCTLTFENSFLSNMARF
jgi:hypothetical protein